MKAVLRILKILVVFFACLFAISIIWYLIESANSAGGEVNSVIDYVLYLIGYGDIEMDDHYSLTLFSVISLFTLTLMSSVFTISLFDLRSKASLLPMIKIGCQDEKYTANAELKTVNKDVYDVTTRLIAKVGANIYSEESYLPFVPKKTVQRIELDFSVGSPLYKYMRAQLESNEALTPLIITLTYTDIEGGQEYKSCAKYTYSKENGDFCYSNKELFEVVKEDYLLCKSFCVDISKATAINGEDIKLSFENSKCFEERSMFAYVDMTTRNTYDPSSFAMACLNDLGERNWQKYADLGCSLTFDYFVQGGSSVTFEFKYGNKNLTVYRSTLNPSEEFSVFRLPLASEAINYEELSNVRELCFTVFYADTDPESHTSQFIIKNCAIEF